MTRELLLKQKGRVEIVIIRRFFLWPVLVALAGCGSGGSNGQLRFLDASLDAANVNFLVDGKSLASNLTYGNINDYTSLKAGWRRIQVVPVNSGTPIFSSNISIGSNTNQTLIISGPVAHLQSDLVSDGGTTATSGDGQVRVLNAASMISSADVYIVSAGASLTGLQPVTPSLTYNKDTGYHPVVAGSYQVFLTAPGTTNVFLTVGPITLTTNQNQTVVILDRISAGFSYTVLTDAP
ncbi:MAG: DUF4397 domain-containing protein [Acidobacteria bacterium]|nr:DUF4397 domain-containing protein [Acidobacteriota bacterium]